MALPDFFFEDRLHVKGYKLIAGADEVGRGCFAGPVTAGCVILDSTLKTPSALINDSKKLSKKQRETADRWIRRHAKAFGIGSASVAQINKFGIKKATEIAFRKAIKSTEVQIDYLLIDAFYIPYVRGLKRRNQKAIIKGDTKSLSIAAASIVAKVYRDHTMTNLSKDPKYKKYRWHANKGYGTKDHRDLIRRHGISALHRTQFVETWLSKA